MIEDNSNNKYDSSQKDECVKEPKEEGEGMVVNQDSIVNYVLDQKKNLSLLLSPLYHRIQTHGDDDQSSSSSSSISDNDSNNISIDNDIWCHLIHKKNLMEKIRNNSSTSNNHNSVIESSQDDGCNQDITISSVENNIDNMNTSSTPPSSSSSQIQFELHQPSINMECIDDEINHNNNNHNTSYTSTILSPQQQQHIESDVVDQNVNIKQENEDIGIDNGKTGSNNGDNSNTSNMDIDGDKENTQPNIITPKNNNKKKNKIKKDNHNGSDDENNNKSTLSSAQPFKNLFSNHVNVEYQTQIGLGSFKKKTSPPNMPPSQPPPTSKQETWTNEELDKLSDSISITKPTDLHYWEKVSKLVGTKDAYQCQMRWTMKFSTPIKEKKKEFIKKEKKISPLNIDKKINVNTIKIKRKAREYLEKNTKKKSKDIFDTTPFKKQHGNIIFNHSKISMSDDEDEIDNLFSNGGNTTVNNNVIRSKGDQEQFTTSSSSSMISFKDIDKEQLDGYIHKISTQMVKEKKKEIKSIKQQQQQNSKAAATVAKKKPIYKPMAEDQKKASKIIGKISSKMEKRRERLDNPDSDNDGDSGYYYSEEEEDDDLDFDI